MKLRHIDNNFYKLTARQAKELAIDGKLPRAGYEKRADASKVALIEPEYRNRTEPAGVFAGPQVQGWIKRTPLSWFAGKPVKSGSVWSIHITKPLS